MKEKQTNHKGKWVYISPTPLPTRGFETARIQSSSRLAKLAKSACIHTKSLPREKSKHKLGIHLSLVIV